MLEKLTLGNFQCHERLTLELDPHVTTIIGESDCGKSAVVRALRWLCFNRPAGTAFVRRVGGKCSVRLAVDGRAVGRHRGGRKGNAYQLADRILRVPGTGVPEDVGCLLNVGDGNFASQHDAPFLLSLSPGEVARRLNSVVNLELIDHVLGAAFARVRKTRTETNVAKDRLKEAKARKLELAWVPGAGAALVEMERLNESACQTAEKRSRLAELLQGVLLAGQKRDRLSEVKLGASEVVRLATPLAVRLTKAEKLRSMLKSLVGAKTRLHQTREARAMAESKLKDVKVCPLCERPVKSNLLEMQP